MISTMQSLTLEMLPILDHVHSQMKQMFEQHNAVVLTIGAINSQGTYVCVSLPSTALRPFLDA